MENTLLAEYFKSLFEYRDGDAFTDTVLNQPLWFHRQQKLKSQCIEDKIKELNARGDLNNDAIFLMKCIVLSFEKTTNYSSLKVNDQERLKSLASHIQFSKYASSLLVTFLIREDDKKIRDVALDILKKGNSTFESTELQIFKEKNTELFTIIFVDLRYSKLSGLELNGIDLSGHNLNGLTIKQTKIENVKFNHCSLEQSNFNSSSLSGCYFKNCNLFKSDFSEILSANGCYFNNCFLANAKFSSSKFKQCCFNGSDFDEITLFNCLFDKCDLLDIYNFVI